MHRFSKKDVWETNAYMLRVVHIKFSLTLAQNQLSNFSVLRCEILVECCHIIPQLFLAEYKSNGRSRRNNNFVCTDSECITFFLPSTTQCNTLKHSVVWNVYYCSDEVKVKKVKLHNNVIQCFNRKHIIFPFHLKWQYRHDQQGMESEY